MGFLRFLLPLCFSSEGNTVESFVGTTISISELDHF